MNEHMIPSQTYVLNGTITAEAPLATCGPELSRTKGKGDPTPIPMIMNGQGKFMYMPAAGFRSVLRGCATQLVREALVARNMPLLSLTDAQLLRVGGIKQAGAEAAMDTIEYQEMIRKNPVLGLFGASTPWVTGKASVGHAICQQPIGDDFGPMVVDGVRTDILRRDPAMVDFLTPDSMDEYRTAIDKVKAYGKIKANIKDLERAAAQSKDTAERKKLRDQVAALKKASLADAVVSAQMPLTGYSAIPVGAVLENKIRLLNASSIELGCFLAAMERFALKPILGAHSAHGAGEVSGSWTVAISGQGQIGTVNLLPYEKLEVIEAAGGHVLTKALADFKAFMATGDLEPWATKALLVGADEESAND